MGYTRIIHEEEFRKCLVQVTNVGGVVIYRKFAPGLYMAPYAPLVEIESILNQVPEVDREEVRQIWQQIQKKILNFPGMKL